MSKKKQKNTWYININAYICIINVREISRKQIEKIKKGFGKMIKVPYLCKTRKLNINHYK